ncbi:hypothetical protein CDIK_3186 [Cucumispora dikerogammari]|nr:hypothetical protein CDIK_3186 [Cucumispora dikerogammari]
MTKTPAIVNEEKKQNIICFLLSATYTLTTSYRQRRSIKRKSKIFTCKNSVFFVNEGDVLKRYFCAHEIEDAESIIKSKHLQGHVGLNKLSKTIARDYSGISIKNIKDYIKRCLECNRETIARSTVRFSPIILS